VLKYSSSIHFDTGLPDSSACSELAKRPSELGTASAEVTVGEERTSLGGFNSRS